MTAQPIRPLVPTMIRTEFGEVLESDVRSAAVGRDVTYVAGYSDMRKARDLAKGLPVAERWSLSGDPEEAEHGRRQVATISEAIRESLAKAGVELPAGRINPGDVPSLPVRLQWVRSQRISGEPDNAMQAQYGTSGYRYVTKDDIGQQWFQEMPAGGKITAGGMIHDSGDCVLMVTDAKTAARNAAAEQYEIAQMTRNSESALMNVGATRKGSDPTFEVMPGPTVPVPRSAIKS